MRAREPEVLPRTAGTLGFSCRGDTWWTGHGPGELRNLRRVRCSFVSLKRAKSELKGHNEELERRVVERTSELMKASEALREAQAELARVTRLTAMGELSASIAHELRQPLAGAITNSDACLAWLSSEPPNLDEARAAADRTIEAATRASDII